MSRELSFEEYQRRTHFTALDGLRGLAVLGVLLHHTRGNPFGMFHGYRGVLVFFVLSGFLITTLALREESAAGRLDIRAFMIRRAFRILPLYYLSLAAFVLWVFALRMAPEADTSAFRHAMPQFLFYVQEFPIWRNGFQIPFAQAWSLGIEEKFYLVWPAIGFWLLARSRFRIGVTLLLLAGGVLLMLQGGWLAQMWGSYVDLLLGCLLAQLLHQPASYGRLALLGRGGIAWIAVALLGAIALLHGTGTQASERVFGLCAGLALVALVTSRGGLLPLLSLPWLTRVGAWSYAIYLVHPIVMDVVNPWLPASRMGDRLSLVVVLLVLLPLCALLHRYVERPLIDRGRRLAKRNASPGLHAGAR